MLLIANATVITRDERRPVIKDGAVVTDADKIAAVGSQVELRERFPGAEFIDARGGLIMPGIINAHDHIYSMFSRGISINGYLPKRFPEILEGMWWKIDSRMTISDTKWSAMASFAADIRNGVTTVIDHHASYGSVEGSLFVIADAAKELGVRVCLCYEVSDRAGVEQMKAAVRENSEFISYCRKKGSNMTKGMMGLHASMTLSDSSLELCRENAPLETGFHIHVAEGIEDEYDSLRRCGKRAVQRLHDHGILGDKSIAGHCIHVNGLEMELLKDTDTMVVHNPESNMGNAVGCPPSIEMMRRGILMGLGTDGFASDMFQSMKMANALHKHSLCAPAAAWEEPPAMLFKNNPKIAGRFFEERFGVLAEGAAADIIVVDYKPHTPLESSNINGHCLFGMCARDVVTTVIAGIVRMRDRQLIDLDEEEIMAKSREQALDLWRRVNE